jgi:hypothetical protein
MLRVRVREKGKDFGLWLPIFLIWPVVLVVVLAVLPLGLLAVATGFVGVGKRRLHWRLPALLVAPLLVVLALAVLLLALATLPVILVVIVLAIPGGVLWVASAKISGRRRPPSYLFPPLLAVLAVATLPLLLMGLVLAVVQLPFVLLAALLLWRRDIGKLLLLSGPRFVGLLSGLRGLKVDVRNGRNQVYVSLW